MFEYVSIVGIIGSVMTMLMVIAMLYLVWLAMGDETHSPSPDKNEQPELADGEEESEPQGELTASNSA